MNCLVWNCHGLRNLRTRKELGDLIQAKDPFVMFIAETWVDEARLITVMWNFDYEHKWIVPREGRRGGLALFWKSSINYLVKDSSKYFIDTIVDKNTDNAWRFTGFYGEPITSRRREAWGSLRRLNFNLNTPWLCARDFNEIVRQEEKLGGSIRYHHQMQLFWDIIDECGFLDLGFTGSQFTWNKHFEDGHYIWERLDRGLQTIVGF